MKICINQNSLSLNSEGPIQHFHFNVIIFVVCCWVTVAWVLKYCFHVLVIMITTSNICIGITVCWAYSRCSKAQGYQQQCMWSSTRTYVETQKLLAMVPDDWYSYSVHKVWDWDRYPASAAPPFYASCTWGSLLGAPQRIGIANASFKVHPAIGCRMHKRVGQLMRGNRLGWKMKPVPVPYSVSYFIRIRLLSSPHSRV
jgi:hypothetical protein